LALNVVNDYAERGVAFVQRYNKLLTKSEEQFQFLLQVVRDNKKNFPNSLKVNTRKVKWMTLWLWKTIDNFELSLTAGLTFHNAIFGLTVSSLCFYLEIMGNS